MLAESVAGKQIAAMRFSFPYLAPVMMLVASNVFMIFAWYGHLKFGTTPLWLVITLLVFAVFSVTFLGEKPTMNHAVGFSPIFAGAWFIFRGPFGS